MKRKPDFDLLDCLDMVVEPHVLTKEDKLIFSAAFRAEREKRKKQLRSKPRKTKQHA